MATLFLTGFNGITTAQIGRRAAYASGVTVGATGRHGQAIRTQGGDGESYICTPFASAATVYAGASVKPVAVHVADDPDGGVVMEFGEDFGTYGHLQLWYDFTDEAFTVYVPHTATELYRGAAGSAPVNTWHFVEVALTVSDAAGAVTFRLNGVTKYAGTSLDTKDGAGVGVEYVQVGGFGMGDLYCDALYVSDSAFFGPCRIDAVFPAAAGSSAQFTPLSSTNVSNVDDGNTPDDATSYNASSTVGHRDLFDATTVTAPTHAVAALCLRVVGNSEPTAGAEISPVLSESGTPVVGTAVALDDADYSEVAMIHPVTAASVKTIATASAYLNALEIGYEVAA